MRTLAKIEYEPTISFHSPARFNQMGTPSSARMVTRSQITKNSVPTSSSKESRQRKTGQALVDITNDSPIVGLTSGSLKTPLMNPSARKGKSKVMMTPGSGEALLRGQVKNLLQMVEEETELQKQQLACRPFVGIYRALADSPIALLAPANTPLFLSSGEQQMGFDELPSPIVQDPIFVSQAVNGRFDEARKEESFESNSSLTRSLMLEFLEKDDSECHSNHEVVESGGSNGKSVVEGDDEKDDSSTWSMQVNASTEDEYEDVGDEVVYKDEHDDYDYDYAEYYDADELCSEMSGLSVNGGTKQPVFTGKHIRFVYNSDQEEDEDSSIRKL